MIFLSETKFWSTSDDLNIKPTDYSTSRYESKKSAPSPHLDGKKSYIHNRGQFWQVPSRRPAKLRDSLQELEEHLKNDTIVYNEWKNRSLLCIIFTSGLIVYLTVDTLSADIINILYDRYLVGKLLITGITGILFTDTYIFVTCNDNQAVLVSFNRTSSKSNGPEKLRKRDPKLQTVDLYGSARRSDRKISSTSENTVLVWSSASPGEVFPWSPHTKGEDRANVHIYVLQRTKIILSCFHRIENDPLFVNFSKLCQSNIHTVEQKNGIKGSTSVEWCIYELVNGGLQVLSSVALTIPAPPKCAKLTPSETRVILTCIDGSLLVCDCSGVIHSVKAAFIPSNICWMGEDALVIVLGDDKGRLQCFDTAATPLRMRPVNEDSTVADISAHSKKQLNLLNLRWNGGTGTGNVLDDSFLLLSFEGGPLAVMRFYGTQVIKCWVRGLGRVNNTSSAVALLKALDWDREGVTCLSLLHAIVNQLLRTPLNPTSELYIQEALGCFHAPRRTLSEEAMMEFGDQVHDLSRKFFHHLLRYGRLEKAMSLAIDLGDSDLFTDVRFSALAVFNSELAQEAQAHALEALSDSDHSTCSRTSCSQCESSENSGSDSDSSMIGEEFFQKRRHSRRARGSRKAQKHREVPPLPYVPPTQQMQPPPIPVVPQPPAASHSIRPNLHQYLDKETSLWSKAESSVGTSSIQKTEKEAIHRVVEIIPKPAALGDISPHYLYQTELPEESEQRVKRHSWMDRVIGGDHEGTFSYYTPVYRHRLESELAPSVSQGYRLNKELSHGRSLNAIHSKVSDNFSGEGRAVIKGAGEKNKVKFSNTVTVAVVPEIQRKEKPTMSKQSSTQVTDPKRELADSLPLCHPNDDYLKDFTPITDKESHESQSKIKVVHFGMV